MKQWLLLFACLILLAACSSDTDNFNASQAEVDSTVNAKIEVLKAEMKAKNDSIINAMATAKADSILKSMKR